MNEQWFGKWKSVMIFKFFDKVEEYYSKEHAVLQELRPRVAFTLTAAVEPFEYQLNDGPHVATCHFTVRDNSAVLPIAPKFFCVGCSGLRCHAKYNNEDP